MLALGFSNTVTPIYSSLFSIMINENTIPSSKLRSVTVSGCFVAFAIGCISINFLAYISTEPRFLLLVTLGLFVVSTVPCPFIFLESPAFTISKGKKEDFYRIIGRIFKINQGRSMN